MKSMLTGLGVLAMGALLAQPAAAESVTFSNAAGFSGGTATVGNTVQITGGRIVFVANEAGTQYFVSGACGGFGCLNLTTGAYNGPDTSTQPNDYLYAGGGSLSIVGTVTTGFGGTGSVIASGTLFNGAFDPIPAQIRLAFDDACTSGTANCSATLAGSLAPGALNPALAAALGVSPATTTGSSNNVSFQFVAAGFNPFGTATTPPSATGTANTNTVVAYSSQNPIPEPGSMVLLGTGLLAAARSYRRRQARNNA